MRRLLPHVGVAFVLFGVLPALAASPAAAAGWTSYDRPAQYGVVEDADVPITMSDGVVLRAMVHRPDAPGRFPVVLSLTPYNGGRGIVGGANDYFVERGYVHVVVDVRGTGCSRRRCGTTLGPREQRDGYELVEWAAHAAVERRQASACPARRTWRSRQLSTAAQRPPHLKAIFPIVPMADGYRDIIFSGGQINIAFIPLWLGLVTGGGAHRRPTYALSGDPDDAGSRCSSADLAGAVNFQAPTVLDSTRPAATSPTTGRSGRRARRSRSSTGSTCRRSSSAASMTSSSAASRWSTSG